MPDTAFSVPAVLGYMQLPDVYTRLQPTGKVGVSGGVLILLLDLLQGGVCLIGANQMMSYRGKAEER